MSVAAARDALKKILKDILRMPAPKNAVEYSELLGESNDYARKAVECLHGIASTLSPKVSLEEPGFPINKGTWGMVRL